MLQKDLNNCTVDKEETVFELFPKYIFLDANGEKAIAYAIDDYIKKMVDVAFTYIDIDIRNY